MCRMVDSGGEASDPRRGWKLTCPACRGELAVGTGLDLLVCRSCGRNHHRREGVWRLLGPGRLEAYEAFLRDYTRIRRAEGRGSADAGHYLRLPEHEPDDPFAWQWRIRKRSYELFLRRVVSNRTPPARVLDLGAGCGWLSHRLSLLGHEPLAVDLSVDERDGLVAARHYDPDWLRAQAEFDRIPVADGEADLAVFNASFHYSVDGLTTLREAVRTLRPGGQVVILDSPIYRDARHGRAMAAQRHADYLKRFATRSDSLPSLEFLTWSQLSEWASALGLQCKAVRPWYGWKWAATPWLAKLRGRRQPARFAVVTLRPATPSANPITGRRRLC